LAGASRLARTGDLEGHNAYYPDRGGWLEADVSDPRRRLGQVLAGQPFPAARWELIVGADLYGADALTMSELHALPAVRFGSLADVLKAVERARHDALDGERGRRSA
jgi:hypothetical protein